MSKPEQDRLLDHDFDGIQEFDNPLPRWWVWMFWASIVFSAAYIPYYHYGPGPLVRDEYDAAMKAYYAEQEKAILALGEINDEAILTLSQSSDAMDQAKQTFRSKCASCHGMFGEGNIGPNLTDPYWIHGGSPKQIYDTIHDGVVTKGMLAWGRLLPPADLVKLASYVVTLQGSNPPNPKEKQGELYEPQPAGGEQPPAPAEENASN